MMPGIEILSSGRSLPKNVYSNNDMKQFVDTDDEWITERTGIKQRYFCNDDESCNSLALKAAEKALEGSGLSKEDISICIVATFTADYATPSTSCMVQQGLGLSENTLCIDLNSACTGFIYALDTARALLMAHQKSYALVVGAEQISKITDFTDRSTCVLFGDGASAVVVKLSDNHHYFSHFGARGNSEVLYSQRNCEKERVVMNGKEVFRFATEVLNSTLKKLLEDAKKTADEVDHIICHQANSRIIDFAAKKAGLSPDRLYKNIDRYGNTSAASIPIALDEMYENKLIKATDSIILIGFGGGLTYGGIYIAKA